MTKKINRRTFLQSSAALATATIASQNSYAQLENKISPSIGGKYSSPALIPAKKGPRVVIVGGGWSGLTMAKYLKKVNPKFDVVLLDKNQQFVSCPISNVWMADQVNLDFLTHSYVEAAQNNDYLFLNATALELDRTSKTLVTTLG
ncbi:MAG: NAD(P)/FAD-dependent oxidoreductase, partial [Gammaproteobacteria bacterium]|nr:NAD(P)/FAD-dependent oxidoreductase [Gammaproteobacteria bacterium]